jgi:hypothetical protein
MNNFIIWIFWKKLKKNESKKNAKNWNNKPMRVLSGPLNQEISATGFACTRHLIIAASPNATY